ncbi:MAG: hypothetical protein H0U76_12760, partial [Ktedonobacteraceae bacterium]|nr:hypothetical protein [Ktedonobacteraceae bacterium]
DDTVNFGQQEQQLLAQVCAEEQVPLELVMSLIENQRQQTNLRSRTAVHARIDELLHNEWRTETEVLAAVALHNERRDVVLGGQ